MKIEKKRRLEQTIAQLEERWGTAAVQRLGQAGKYSPPCTSTGYTALDEALGTGGLPKGRITEITGAPTSGLVTLSFTIAAQSQGPSSPVVCMDLGQNFDPHFAALCGLDLNNLILVRPPNVDRALMILHDFAAGGGLGCLVFDADPLLFSSSPHAKSLATTLDRIISPLSQTSCLLLFVTASYSSQPSGIIPHHAAVRLHLHREKWLYKDGDIAGYKTRIVVVKNKLGPAGKQVILTIHLEGTDASTAVSTRIAPFPTYEADKVATVSITGGAA